MTQYIALVSLWDRDGQTIGEVGRALRLESNTLTPMFKRLEAAGLIERRRDKEDERQVRLYLTQKGRALETDAGDLPACIQEATGLDPTAIHDLRKNLSTLCIALDAALAQ